MEPVGALTAPGEPPEAAGLCLGKAQIDGRTWQPLGRGSFPDRLWEEGTVAEAASCGGKVTGKIQRKWSMNKRPDVDSHSTFSNRCSSLED